MPWSLFLNSFVTRRVLNGVLLQLLSYRIITVGILNHHCCISLLSICLRTIVSRKEGILIIYLTTIRGGVRPREKIYLKKSFRYLSHIINVITIIFILLYKIIIVALNGYWCVWKKFCFIDVIIFNNNEKPCRFREERNCTWVTVFVRLLGYGLALMLNARNENWGHDDSGRWASVIVPYFRSSPLRQRHAVLLWSMPTTFRGICNLDGVQGLWLCDPTLTFCMPWHPWLPVWTTLNFLKIPWSPSIEDVNDFESSRASLTSLIEDQNGFKRSWRYFRQFQMNEYVRFSIISKLLNPP